MLGHRLKPVSTLDIAQAHTDQHLGDNAYWLQGGKYSIEGCDKFETLSDLIDYNKQNPMSETDGSVITLECVSCLLLIRPNT